MTTFLRVIIILASLIVSLSILMQEKGAGLSLTFGGGSGASYYSSKRGIHKLLHWTAVASTIVLFLAVFVFSFIGGRDTGIQAPTETPVTATGGTVDSPTIDVQPADIQVKDETGSPVKVRVEPAAKDGAAGEKK